MENHGGKTLAVLILSLALLAPVMQAATSPSEAPQATIDPNGSAELPEAPGPDRKVSTPGALDDLEKNDHKPCGPASGCLPIDGPQFVDEHGDKMFGDLIMESVLRFPSRDSQRSAGATGSGGPSGDDLNPDHLDDAPWGIVVEADNRVLMNESSLLEMANGSTFRLENGSTLLARENAEIVIPGLVTEGGDTVTISGDNLVQLSVGDEPVLRIVDTDGTANIIGANETNDAMDGTMGVIIAGGGTTTSPNTATDDFATISGGGGNQAGDGDSNPSDAPYATVGGGLDNTASGVASTVSGGQDNFATGDHSQAAGRTAQALHDGTYVWSGSGTTAFASTGPDQYLIDAAGGVGIGTNAPASALSVEGDVTPATDATHALGSPSLRWTDLYLNSVIHHNGDLTFVDSSGTTTATLRTDGSLELPDTVTAGTFIGNGSGLTGVQAEELAEDTVTSATVADGEIATVDIAPGAVTSDRIATDAVGADQIATGAVGSDEIATSAVGSPELADGSILLEDVAQNGCTGDQVIKWNATSTAWECAADEGETFTAGTGITITETNTIENDLGTSITSDEIQDATIQLIDLAQNACSDGETIKWSSATTEWVCAADQDTTYTAGDGLTLSGTEFAALLGSSIESSEITDGTIVAADVDSTSVQERVSGTCPTGESIREIAQGGTVTCEADDDTTYTAGTGLTLDGTTFSNDLGTSIESAEITDGTIAFADLGQNGCTDTQVMKWDDPNATWSCAEDEGEVYTAGDGLTLSGTEFSNDLGTSIESGEITDGTIAFADLGQNGCSQDHVMKWTNETSEWLCAVDQIDGGNAATLDSLDSTAFLRSDTSDTFAGSLLTVGGTTGLQVDQELGINTGPGNDHKVNAVQASSNAGYTAVRGAGVFGPTVGYMGAQGATDFDGVTTADWGGQELGAVGISVGSSTTDNFGVKGHSNGVGVRGEYSGNPTGTYGELGHRSGYGLVADGNVAAARFLEDIRVEGASGTDDDAIYFDTGTAEHLMWDESADRFEFSNDLEVQRLVMALKILEVTGGDLVFDGSEVCLASGNCGGSRVVAVNDVRLTGVSFSSTGAGGEIAGDSGPDVTPVLETLNTAGVSVCYIDEDGDTTPDTGEPLYLNVDADTCSGESTEAGDLRLTANAGELAFTVVRASHDDFNLPLTASNAPGLADGGDELAYHDGDGNGVFNAADTMYADVDSDGVVSPGDLRWTASDGSSAGTKVTSGDSDVNRALAGTFVLDTAAAYWDSNPTGTYDLNDDLYIDISEG